MILCVDVFILFLFPLFLFVFSKHTHQANEIHAITNKIIEIFLLAHIFGINNTYINSGMLQAPRPSYEHVRAHPILRELLPWGIPDGGFAHPL